MKPSTKKAITLFMAIVGIVGMIFFTVLPLFAGLGGGYGHSGF